MVMPIRPEGDLPGVYLEAERQTLGSCLLKPEYLRDIDLSLSDFFGEKHRVIWRELQYLAAEGMQVDTLHLSARLQEIGKLAFVTIGYLDDLTDIIPTEPPVELLKRGTRQRTVRALARRLTQAIESGDDSDAIAAIAAAKDVLEPRPLVQAIEWRGTEELFAPLPEVPWRVRGLQICPGRPCILGGYGASAKTLSAQQLALAVASGTPVWGFFDVPEAMPVRHLDYEQGWHATARRYQRLAHGHHLSREQLGDRLQLAVFPRVYLDQPDAYDAYARVAEGTALVVLDALRGAAPGSDENDSGIRRCIDTLTRVSESTGCAFVMLHHARKTQKDDSGDAREGLRGSAAIFDGAGAVYELKAAKDPTAPRNVRQTKAAAEAAGRPVEPFLLDVLDVPAPGDPEAGVRVMHKPVEKSDGGAAARADDFTAQMGAFVALVRANPGQSRRVLFELAKVSDRRGTAVCEELERRGVLRHKPGPHNTKFMYLTGRDGSVDEDM